MKWNDLTMKERSDLMSLFLKHGIGSLSDMRHIYDGLQDTDGGYTEDSKEKRNRIHKKYDPAGGFYSQWLYNGNHSKGEEDQYWRAYLGIENAVPKMNENAKTSWDDKIEKEKVQNGELPSDFYGTTAKMDQTIQAIADTLNTGKIYRNYKEYKKKYPFLPSKGTIEHVYRTGKAVMENPGKWTQVKEGPQLMIQDRYENNERAPLGMLADFGMMWNPDENAIYVHDTYDFPGFLRNIGGIPKRPKEMKIRGRIEFDPEKGSYLLREDMKNYYNMAPGISMVNVPFNIE